MTIVILTGLTGNSQAEYIRETVAELSKKGYCCVVFNYRGRGGVKLKVKLLIKIIINIILNIIIIILNNC